MLTISEITPDNLGAMLALRLRPGQDRFVAPVATSLAEAYVSRETAWPRAILDDDEVVGFVMGAFDPDNELHFFRCGIWRLNVSGDRQGRGVGAFAVGAVADEAKRHGQDRLTVLWVPGDDGPEGFYRRVGFRPTGETFAGQAVGELPL